MNRGSAAGVSWSPIFFSGCGLQTAPEALGTTALRPEAAGSPIQILFCKFIALIVTQFNK
jgi:hypothetical protein